MSDPAGSRKKPGEGKVKISGVFSQGESVEELKENIRDSYNMIMQVTDNPPHPESSIMEIEVSV